MAIHNGNNPNIKDMFDKSSENIDKRLFERLKSNIRVSIKNFKNKFETEARSTNISRSGIGVFLQEKLNIGDKLELWVHLADGLKPIHRFGRLVWLDELSPVAFNGGIKFESLVELPA